MAVGLLERVEVGTGAGDDSDLVATVVLLGGRRYDWRDASLKGDIDVTAWQCRALDAAHPHYAPLFRADLAALRASTA